MKTFIVTNYDIFPGDTKPQTKKIQDVLDLCKDSGGRIVFPKGEYCTGSLYVHSNTEIYLESGAIIKGSDEISDYSDIDIPENIQAYHDYIVLKPQIDMWQLSVKGYTRSLFYSVNEKNITYIGEPDSLIDGVHCFNADGDQGYRGPHTIWMTACENIVVKGINITRSGNFAFQMDGCSNILVEKTKVIRGDDGIHLNCSHNINIRNSVFETGDDCIAGLNVTDLTVENCFISSACDDFRLGGKNILIKGCHMEGPCKYPHRLTTFKGKNYDLPDIEGRRNTNVFFCFFASDAFPMDSENILIEDCEINGVDRLVYSSDDFGVFQSGGILKEITFKNVKIKDILLQSIYTEDTAFTFKNVTFTSKK